MDQQQPPGTPQQHHQKQADPQFLSLSRQVSDLLSRLRLLEERYANLRREHQTTSQNMIENHQNLSRQQRKINDNTIELKRGLRGLNEQMMTMGSELSEAASSHDLKALEHYLNFWQPLNFLTREQAEKVVHDALEARKVYKESGGQED